MSGLSDKELDDVLKGVLKNYIDINLRPQRIKKEDMEEDDEGELPKSDQVFFSPSDDPNLVSIVASYVSLRSQEKMSKQNNRLQFWLAALSTITVFASILPTLLKLI